MTLDVGQPEICNNNKIYLIRWYKDLVGQKGPTTCPGHSLQIAAAGVIECDFLLLLKRIYISEKQAICQRR